MKVLKFGGTSVGSAQRMKDVAQIISDTEQQIVVLSAMSGTTNTLLQIAEYIKLGNPCGATDTLTHLEKKYEKECSDLGISFCLLQPFFSELRDSCFQSYSLQLEKDIVAHGELLSTTMMLHYLQSIGRNAVMLPALDYMRIYSNEEPNIPLISSLLKEQLQHLTDSQTIITQGFICRREDGKIDNLKRGGSDYSASIIGAILEVEEIQIWTDIDGMHNNDPRFVDNTSPVPQLSFDEAAELAYFGAKILHPTCILPAKMHNVPVRLLNTMDPAASGTLINNDFEKGRIEAVAAKDGIAAIRIHSDRMLLAYGFLSRVFAIFDKYKTPIDLITTSEVAVSMSVDNLTHIDQIVEELKSLGTVSLETNMTIISVVGDLRSFNLGFQSQVINALHDIPIRMISYGGSDHNISILIGSDDKKRALQSLSKYLFN